MVEILPAPAPGIVALRVEGSADEAEANSAVVETAMAEAGDVTGLFVEIGWVWGDTPEEFADLVRERFGRLAEQPSVRRVAFVSASYPRRSALRAEAERIDVVEVEVFPAAARNAALDWVAEAVASTS